jgi:hypothetical protein
MGMPKGFAKATNYYNRLEAWNDWRKLAAQATQAGFGELVTRHQPPEGAGWRRVDKHIARLKAALAAQQHSHDS